MPFVTVRYAPHLDSLEVIAALSGLPEIIARSLTCDDNYGQLSAGDVEVKFEEQSPNDITKYQIEILVSATDFPSRRSNINDRAERIATIACNTLAHHNVFGYELCIFVTLSPAGFAERLVFGGKR